MERLEFSWEGGGAPPCRPHAIAGVVGSGNCEVLIERVALDGACAAVVETAVHGYAAVWRQVLADFVARHRLADARISVNDGGATPAVVVLRLDQAAALLAP